MTMFRRSLIPLLLLASIAPASAHGWYTGLRDGKGVSCCDNHDCHPVGVCVLPDRKEGLVIQGACQPIPWDKVLKIASPDGGAHACWYFINGRPSVQCVILPGAV